MKRFYGLPSLVLERDHSVLTIGNFDGVHLGHQELLSKTVELAKLISGPACVFTFRPHPQEVLRPGQKVKLLSRYDEKLEMLEQAGIDITVEELFSQDFFSQTAREFFLNVVVHGFKARHLVVGHDFAFGKNREGTFAVLEALCQEFGVTLHQIPAMKVGDQLVSSSNIRSLLQAASVHEAEKLLGRFFFYRGVVRKGDQRGRLLGFPTANLRIEEKLELPNGVYATWTLVTRGGKAGKYPSVTNIGVRPTFQSEEGKLVETHLILTNETTIDLYGEEIEVQFVERFREEKKFASFDELKTQIAHDRERARAYFNLI